MNGVLQQVEWESCLVEPFPAPALQSYARRFVPMAMPAEFVKGIAEPVVTYAVREGPSAAAPSAEEAGDR